MSQLIGQNMIIGLSGKQITEEEKKFLIKNDIGGVVLFSRNVEDVMQVWNLCQEIQSLRSQTPSKAPFFISIDMEGGRVHRLKQPFTQWPAASTLGQVDSPNIAFQFAQKMGEELKAVGINLDFAPCVDVLTNPNNTVIGDRAVSSDFEQVGKLASALVRGYIKSGIIPCAKHFPGHGNTLVDSHDDLPRESLDLERLQSVEIQPFKKAFRARLDMVMTSHILFEKIDPDNPVTFSSKFLRDLLREDLRFRGLIISDDLDMGALSKHYSTEEIPVRALQAGCDILLYCNRPESHEAAIESLSKALADGKLNSAELEESRKKILDIKNRVVSKALPMELAAAQSFIGNEVHRTFADTLSKGQIPHISEEA